MLHTYKREGNEGGKVEAIVTGGKVCECVCVCLCVYVWLAVCVWCVCTCNVRASSRHKQS